MYSCELIGNSEKMATPSSTRACRSTYMLAGWNTYWYSGSNCAKCASCSRCGASPKVSSYRIYWNTTMSGASWRKYCAISRMRLAYHSNRGGPEINQVAGIVFHAL